MRAGTDYSWKQITGERESQQDSCRIVPPAESGESYPLWLALADGMGGHAGGAAASRIAIDLSLIHI